MRWIMIAIVIAFLLSTFLMYDRGSSRREPSYNPDGSLQDYVVASINGRELMRSELETMIRNYIQQLNIRELTSEDIPYLYQATLDSAVFNMELNKEVDSRNLDVSEDEITFQVNVMADRFPTREAFFHSIERRGVKMEDLREDIRLQIKTEKTIANALGDQTISDEALFEFYDVMQALLFSRPKGFLFDLIELSNDVTAEDLRAKIADDSEKWEEIISEHPRSSDVVRRSPEPLFLSEFALSEDKNLSYMITLDIGEVGHVTEVGSNDYLVAIKRGDREASVAPFEEVSGDIRMMLEQQQQRSAFEEFRNDMISRAVVEIYDHSLFPDPATADAPEEPGLEGESEPVENDAPETGSAGEPEAEIEEETPVVLETVGAPETTSGETDADVPEGAIVSDGEPVEDNVPVETGSADEPEAEIE